MDRLTDKPGKRAVFWAVALILASGLSTVRAQSDQLEEIVVGFEVPKLIKQDVFVQYDGKNVFVPLIETFQMLGFNVAPDLANERITGTVGGKSDKFIVDLTRFKIITQFGDRELLRPEYFYDGRDFYLRIDLYGQLFGLHMMFDFSLLRVLLPLDENFPSYQKIKRQKDRAKLQEQKESLRDVLSLPREHSYLSGGVADWRISTAPLGGGAQYFDLDMGGVVMGGDLEIAGGGNTEQGLRTDQIDYLWHYYIEGSQYVTQVKLGKYYTSGSLARGLTGASVTNQPQVRRKYFQTIRLTGQPGEGWEVELYVDNRLVDFVTTDANGHYDFNVDIFYGTASVKLQLYGPNGEMRTEEQHVRIPFNLIPEGEFEYTASFGKLTGYEGNRAYGQGSFYYGILSRVTAGVSVDLPVSPLEKETPLYSAEATFQPFTNMTLGASVAPRYRSEADFNFTWPSVVNVGAHFATYEENPLMNPVRQAYRWQASLSSPLRFGRHYIGLRLNASQDKFAGFTSTSIGYGFSTTLPLLYLNYIGQYKLNESQSQETSELVSKLMGSVAVHRRFRPQFRIDYNHTDNQISKYSVMLTRRLWRSAQATVTYERSPESNSQSIMLNVHLYTDFMEVSSRSAYSGGSVSMSQIHRGSVRYDQGNGRVIFDRRGSVGYGSAVVRPFLDENYNGRMDSDEQYLSGLKAKISGVGGMPRGKDKIYYYDRLRPYDEYLVGIDKYSLDNPMLKPSNETFRVTPNPNVVTSIEVPIVQASEVSGSVKRQVGAGLSGVGGFRIILLNVSKDVVTEVSTFNDGVFFYLGLLPGSYRAYIDAGQLQKYGYVCDPPAIEFDIRPIAGGETIENLDFTLSPAPVESQP